MPEATNVWSDWDAESHGLECEAGVCLTIGAWPNGRWLSWDETVALHRWLGEKIKEYHETLAKFGSAEPAP